MRKLKVLAVIFVMSLGLFAAESPFTGTWKLNVGKSKMPQPGPKAETDVIDANDSGIKITSEITDDKDQQSKISFDAKFEGKDYPVTGDPNMARGIPSDVRASMIL